MKRRNHNLAIACVNDVIFSRNNSASFVVIGGVDFSAWASTMSQFR